MQNIRTFKQRGKQWQSWSGNLRALSQQEPAGCRAVYQKLDLTVTHIDKPDATMWHVHGKWQSRASKIMKHAGSNQGLISSQNTSHPDW